MASLLALARAGFERAKGLNRYRVWAHLGTLAVGCGGLFSKEPVAYLLSVAALLTEVVALWLRHEAGAIQAKAEEAHRRVLLIDGLGATEEPLDTTDLRQAMASVEGAAEALEDPAFYASTESAGPARLLAHLQESAFWSKHLYAAAATRGYRVWLGSVCVILCAFYFAEPLLTKETSLLLAKMVLVFLAFFAAVDGLARAMAWSAAERQADAIDRRLEHVTLGGLQEPLLAAFADYAVATASCPPIPSRIYAAEKERLNALWRVRKGSAGGSA